MSRDLVEEFAGHLGVPVDSLDAKTVERLRVEAQALIHAAKPTLPASVDQWPENAFVVLLRVMARGVGRGSAGGLPTGVKQVSENSGDFSYSFSLTENAQGGGLWLTKQDRLILGARVGGAYTVDLGVRAHVPGAVLRGRDQW